QQDYIAEWDAFLKSGKVVPYTSLADASQKLTKISGNQSPLLALFCLAAQNTAESADIAKAFEPVQDVVPPHCAEQQYIGGSNTAYVNGLMAIPTCLDQANNASTPDQKESAKTQCVSVALPAKQAAQQIANSFKVNQKETAPAAAETQRLLLEPITDLSLVLRPQQATGEGLCQQMSVLMNKFPFKPDATAEASLDDVKTIFDPAGGSLSQLNNAVTKSGQQQGINFRNFVERAVNFQHALYMGGPGQPQFKYKLRPHGTETIASLDMNLNGQSLSYSGGNAGFADFSWPGTTQAVRLTAKSSSGSPFDLHYE